jgi:hypothetical protein
MRSHLAIFAAFILISATLPAHAAEENTTREFVMSCTYGVLAGTLVGAASLAFTSKPSDNMFRVARGASIGLYAGILLGLYVVYIVPGMEQNPDEIPVAKLDKIPILAPTFGANFKQIDGLQADWTVLRF